MRENRAKTPDLRPVEVARRGVEVARFPAEVARRGAEVARFPAEVARHGVKVARFPAEVARRGVEVARFLEKKGVFAVDDVRAAYTGAVPEISPDFFIMRLLRLVAAMHGMDTRRRHLW